MRLLKMDVVQKVLRNQLYDFRIVARDMPNRLNVLEWERAIVERVVWRRYLWSMHL